MQSHLWLTASSYMTKYLRISSYIRKTYLIYVPYLHLIPSKFPDIWGKFSFLFISAQSACVIAINVNMLPSVVDTSEQLDASIVDTGVPWIANIFANFQKNSKSESSGPRRRWFMKNTYCTKNFVALSLLPACVCKEKKKRLQYRILIMSCTKIAMHL